jgi:hypothetical protein
MKHVYLFEIYKYGYDIESPEYEEEIAQSIEEARSKLLVMYPKAHILNEYIKVAHERI